MRLPNQKSRYAKLNGRLNKYVLSVQNIYDKLNLEAAKIVDRSGFLPGGVFRFSDFPMTADAVNKLQNKFVNEMHGLIYRGTSEEWKNSNLVQDLLATKALKSYGATIGGQKTKVYYQTNSDALIAFQNRVDKGMNLSTKLWNQAGNYKQELEYAISSAIEKGTSAVTLSKRLSKYLNDFPSLKADYKEKFGTAVDCHDCEYRSMRLARSEINMAYRTAEQTRWNQMDFVVGYEIKLSGAHPHEDICDVLAGKYPKDFFWTGWHPNDMCYVIPILKTEGEFWDDNPMSVNQVEDVPQGFKGWVVDNQERLAQAELRGTLPYWYADNQQYIRANFGSTIDDVDWLLVSEEVKGFHDYKLLLSERKGMSAVIEGYREKGLDCIADGIEGWFNGTDLANVERYDDTAREVFRTIVDESRYKGEIYRGFSVSQENMHILEGFKVGDVFTGNEITRKTIGDAGLTVKRKELGLASCTKSKFVAEEYASNAIVHDYEQHGETARSMVFVTIEAGEKKALDAQKLFHAREEEVVLSHQQKLRLTKIKKYYDQENECMRFDITLKPITD